MMTSLASPMRRSARKLRIVRNASIHTQSARIEELRELLCGSRESKGVIHLSAENAEGLKQLTASTIAMEKIISEMATQVKSLVDVTQAHAERLGGIEGQRDKGVSWIVIGAIQIIVLLGGIILGSFFRPVNQPGFSPTPNSTHQP